MSSPNPYQQQIQAYQQQLANNQALLDNPEFASVEMQQLIKEEIEQLKQELQTLEQAAQAMTNLDNEAPADPTQSSNAIIEIRGGAGGDEAKIWAGELMRMYSRFCQNQGLKIELIDDLVFKVRGQTNLPVYQLQQADNKTTELELTEEEEKVTAFNLLRSVTLCCFTL